MLKNNYIHLALIIFVSTFYVAIMNKYIQTDEMYFSFLIDNYPKELAIRIFESSHAYNFLFIYIISPLLIILRTLIFAVMLDAVLTCKNIYQHSGSSSKYRFGDFWRIFICAEWSTVAFIVLKFNWFAFVDTNYALNDLMNFSPLSLYSLTENHNIESWLIYPFKICNLFEFAYIVIAVITCKKALAMDYLDSIFYIFLSYLVPSFVFVIFIMYLNIYFQ